MLWVTCPRKRGRAGGPAKLQEPPLENTQLSWKPSAPSKSPAGRRACVPVPAPGDLLGRTHTLPLWMWPVLAKAQPEIRRQSLTPSLPSLATARPPLGSLQHSTTQPLCNCTRQGGDTQRLGVASVVAPAGKFFELSDRSVVPEHPVYV